MLPRDQICRTATLLKALLTLVILLLGPAGCAATVVATLEDPEAETTAIRGVLTEQQAAWNAGDIEAFMRGYVQRPDLVFTSGGKVRRGYQATLEKYRKSYADKGNMGHLEFELLQVRFLGSHAALVMGRFVLTETPKSGSGLFTLVFEKTDDGWRVIHDHTSGDAKPARAPTP
ncbi:MAG: hypothetical protein ACI9WU_003383 [Myxococcota bacterium]|jgi:uncharacterized protein (TIGR02246 family)